MPSCCCFKIYGIQIIYFEGSFFSSFTHPRAALPSILYSHIPTQSQSELEILHLIYWMPLCCWLAELHAKLIFLWSNLMISISNALRGFPRISAHAGIESCDRKRVRVCNRKRQRDWSKNEEIDRQNKSKSINIECVFRINLFQSTKKHRKRS